MAKGREVYEARLAEVNLLGKDLARRARSSCELCEIKGVPLAIYEVKPVPTLPDPAKCLMLCQVCREQVEDLRRFRAGEQWRGLAEMVWSELPVVQVVAVRLLRRMSPAVAWAREALESIELDEEIAAWVSLDI
jgi:protein PhnA